MLEHDFHFVIFLRFMILLVCTLSIISCLFLLVFICYTRTRTYTDTHKHMCTHTHMNITYGYGYICMDIHAYIHTYAHTYMLRVLIKAQWQPGDR